MNWLKDSIGKLMFWREETPPDYEITDCWPDIPDSVDQVETKQSLASDAPTRDPTETE